MGNYLLDLRKKVGHEPLMSAGAAVVIENEKGELLLEKRTDNGLYCFPGGGIELGEKIANGAKREVYEETGIVLGEIVPMKVMSGKEGRLVYPNGDECYYIDFYFKAKVSNVTPRSSDGESVELKFVGLNDFPPEERCLRNTYDCLNAYLHFNGIPEID